MRFTPIPTTVALPSAIPLKPKAACVWSWWTLRAEPILETTRSVAAGVNELNLDMRDAANGIYLLKLHDGNRTFTAKVAKN